MNEHSFAVDVKKNLDACSFPSAGDAVPPSPARHVISVPHSPSTSVGHSAPLHSSAPRMNVRSPLPTGCLYGVPGEMSRKKYRRSKRWIIDVHRSASVTMKTREISPCFGTRIRREWRNDPGGERVSEKSLVIRLGNAVNKKTGDYIPRNSYMVLRRETSKRTIVAIREAVPPAASTRRQARPNPAAPPLSLSF